MDSLSQIILGASVGEAVLGRKIGNRAILFGAIAGTIPDLDVFFKGFYNTVQGIAMHRGFSHSLVFTILGSFLFGWLFYKLTPKRLNTNYKEWYWFTFLCFITHIALDCFTTWGTQVFWPLDLRVSFNSVFVADPLYTVPFLLLLVTLMFFRKDRLARRRLNIVALSISTFYLGLGLILKQEANKQFEDAFINQGYEVISYESRPAPFTTILWTVNAELKDRYLLGYYSLLDSDNNIKFIEVPKQHELLKEFEGNRDIETLKLITTGYYAISRIPNGIVINDLRFGKSTIWEDEESEFVFRYIVQKNENGFVSIENPEPPRPKSKEELNWILKTLYSRILGDKTPSRIR